MGCRARAAKADLLRVVAAGELLVPDPAGRLPGRGASVHLDPRCVALAETRRAFPRALRLPGPLDLGPVRDHVATVLAARPQDPQHAHQGSDGPPRQPDRQPDPPDHEQSAHEQSAHEQPALRREQVQP